MVNPAIDVNGFELPLAIKGLRGQMIDADQHECTPINMYIEEFGSVTKPMIDAWGKTSVEMKEKVRDDAEINAENIFRSKLENAPGAFDFARRAKVLDYLGFDRALVYPGSLGMISITLSSSNDRSGFIGRLDVEDPRAYGRKLMAGYNAWCMRASRITDRLRPVAVLVADTPDDLYRDAKALVDGGVRAIWLPSGILPGGVSPAHPDLDRLWALLADADCPVVDHIGGTGGFLSSQEWHKAPAFSGWSLGDGEFSMDPWVLTNAHYSAQSFVVAMVIGGVFERHPRLRYGTAELTGHWVGPMAEMMDLWIANKPFRSGAGDKVLTMKPSDYLRRNVRVGCFDFEPIDKYIERFGFEEVYCYGSDYPHPAGGEDPIGVATRNLEHLGQDVLQGFFVDNGKFLLPD